MPVALPLSLEGPVRSSGRAFRLKGLAGAPSGGNREVGADSLAHCELCFKPNCGSKPLERGAYLLLRPSIDDRLGQRTCVREEQQNERLDWWRVARLEH